MNGRRIGAALATSAIVSLLLAGSASAFKPRVGTYTGSTPGTSSTGAPTTNSLSVLLTNKHKRTFKTTITGVADDCAGGFVVTPLPLGRLFAKDFKYNSAGTSGSVSYSVSIEGRFISPTKPTGKIRSAESSLAPPPGETPTVCKDDTSFTLFYTGGGKKK